MTKRAPCPQCRSEGEDRDGNNLTLFKDDPSRGYCFKHNKAYNVDGSSGETVQRTNTYQDISIEVIKAHYPIKTIKDFPVSLSVLERFGVHCSVNEQTGQVDRVYYPYHDQDKNVCGYKVRKFPKDFTVVGKIKGLFGQAICKQNARLLVMTEGEKDCLAVAEFFQRKNKNWNVVSIPNGANEDGQIDAATRRELEWIVAHEKVVLCFDMDKPGQETARALAELLASQTTVAIMSLPKKDAGKLLEDGQDDEFWKALSNCKAYRPEAIIDGADVDFDEIMKPDPPGIDLPFPKLNYMLKGLRPAEITLFVAGSGIGKSSLCGEISSFLIDKGKIVANVSLETQHKDVVKGYIARDNNVPLWKLKLDENAVPREAAKRSFDKIMGSGKVKLFKHFGSIDSKELINKFHYFRKAMQCDFIVLDHISMVISGSETQDERRDIDQLMTSLAKFVVETGCGVIAVVHLKRVAGKSFNHGDEVELTDLRGSAALEQLSWNVIAAERNMQDEEKKNITKIRVLKNRTIGYTGLCDSLVYSHETGRLTALSTEY